MVAKLSSCKWQVAPSSGQMSNQLKWCQVMVIFRTDPSGATCRLRDYSSYGLNFWVRCASGNVFSEIPRRKLFSLKVPESENSIWDPTVGPFPFLHLFPVTSFLIRVYTPTFVLIPKLNR